MWEIPPRFPSNTQRTPNPDLNGTTHGAANYVVAFAEFIEQ